MAAISPCRLIAEHVGSLYQCSPAGKYIRIHTPFLYPDGDALDLYWREDFKTISDVGETLRWLDDQTLTQRRSKRHLALIDDVCATNGVRFSEGNLSVHVATATDMASAVMRLSQACVQVADLWFTFRTRMFESFPDEVEELLATQPSLQVTRGETITGNSGKPWKVDFHTISRKAESLIFTLSTGTRGATRRIAEHVVAACVDLGQTKKIALFDDTVDVWGADDFKLVEAVSEVQRWSRQDEFLDALAA